VRSDADSGPGAEENAGLGLGSGSGSGPGANAGAAEGSSPGSGAGAGVTGDADASAADDADDSAGGRVRAGSAAKGSGIDPGLGSGVGSALGPGVDSGSSFVDQLPAVYVGSGALITNAANEVLLVNPTYKPGWEIPGGTMDPAEYPRETLRRELVEELGFELVPGPLLVVDFTLMRPERPRPNIMYVFDCGVLDERQQAEIRLPEDELSEFRFTPADELEGMLPGRLMRRVRAALAQRLIGGTVDLENGYAPGEARRVGREGTALLD
jgi:8-oxo-dGTP diphosphatase